MEEFVQSVMATLGSAGIALLMFLENIFPPIPSELIMPLAGYLTSLGEMHILTVIAAGTLGSLCGIVPWYFLGKWLGYDGVRKLAVRHGRWLTMTPADVDSAAEKFARNGKASVLLGRLIPTVRTLISIPAGVAGMPFGQFLVLSAIGTFLWTSALASSGYLLGQAYGIVKDYVDPVSTIVMCLLIGTYIYRVVTYKGAQQ